MSVFKMSQAMRTIFDLGHATRPAGHAAPSSYPFPIEVTREMPLDQMIMVHSDVIAAIRLSESAQTMARHGILPQNIADNLQRDVEAFVEQEARDGRLVVIKNLCI